MSNASSSSPWTQVLGLIEHFEDALVVMSLFEYRDPMLLVNGHSLAEVVEGFPSERGLADLLASRMLEIEGGEWTYTDFYRPSRGNLEATEEEVRAFVERCAANGLRLHYDDGTDAGETWAPPGLEPLPAQARTTERSPFGG